MDKSLSRVKEIVTNCNIAALYDELIKNDDNFKKFVEDNKELSIEQIANKYNITSDALKLVIA